MVVALCSVCRDARGSWGMATLAAHPGGFARTTVTPTAAGDPDAFGVRLDGTLRGDAAGVELDLGPDARLEARLHDAVRWPRRPFGALGLAHAVPGLPQYWHPVVLAAGVSGSVRAGELVLPLDGAVAYVEKNWGRGFPGRWWWGQAATFPDPEVGLAFAGGHLPLPGADVAPTAVVVRLGARRLALSPPLHRTRASLADGAWRLATRGPRYRVDIEGDAAGSVAHALDVPVPGERRTADGARQHLAGRIDLTVRAGRRVRYRGSRGAGGPRGQRPVARRSARLSGSEATSGSKRPITAHSARSRRRGRAVDRLDARGGAQVGAAVRAGRDPVREHDAHRVRLVPARERLPAGQARVVAGERPDPAAQPGDEVTFTLVEHDERIRAEQAVERELERGVRDPPRDQAPERARVAQPDLARDPPQALRIAGHRAAALRADARPGRPGVEVRPGAHDHRRHCRSDTRRPARRCASSPPPAERGVK